MKRNGLIGTALAVSGSFGISWLGAIVYWRAGMHSPGPAEVAGLLLGMPTAMLAAAAWWRRRSPRDEVPAADASSARAEAATAGVGRSPAPIAAFAATAINLPCGDSAAAIVDNRAGLSSPGLHPELRDPGGIPVFIASIDTLDPASMQTRSAGAGRPEWLRALSAIEPVLDELLGTLDTPPAGALALVPADWSTPECEGLESLVSARLAPAGDDPRPWLRVERVDTGTQAWARIAEVAPMAGSGSRVVCLATASNVGARTVSRRGSSRQLMCSANPQGRVPGEGAAGVVLADPATAAVAPRWLGTRCGPRGNTRDRGGAASGLIEALLQHSALDAEAIGLLASDADHRVDGLVEVGSALSKALPEFDAADDALHLGQSCGDCGAVLALAALAIAANASESLAAPTLALSMDPGDRSIALFATAPEPASGNA